MGGPQPPSPSAGGSGNQTPAQERKASTDAAVAVPRVNGTRAEPESPKCLKRAMKDVNFLDASKEGNVGRFINVSGRHGVIIAEISEEETHL